MSEKSISSFSSEEKKPDILSEAILFYGEIATFHKIDMVNNVPVIKPGRPLTRIDIEKWISAIAPTPKLTEIGDEILATNNNTLIWWTPPQIRQSWFNIRNENLKNLKEKTSFPISYPGMIFIQNNNSTYVFAFKGRKKPNFSTELFHAPVLNVYDSGSVCWGNIRPPNRTDENLPEQVETWLFESWSTHTNSSNNIKYKGGIEKFIDKISTDAEPKIPQSKLVSQQRTLSDFVSTLR